DADADRPGGRGRPGLSHRRHDPPGTLLNGPVGAGRGSPRTAPRRERLALETRPMDPMLTWLPPAWALGVPIALSLPIGWWMARTLAPPDDRAGRGLDALPMAFLRLLGRRAPARMDWKQYACAFLAFNATLFVLTFALLSLQQFLPLNPDGKGSL